jgi:hypothetical protein
MRGINQVRELYKRETGNRFDEEWIRIPLDEDEWTHMEEYLQWLESKINI